MSAEPYAYRPIVDRPRFRWPGDKGVAFYLGLNIEHYELGKRATSISQATVALSPDPLNHGWRDYGLRVGFWRMLEALDAVPLRASALVNSDVCEHYPEVIDAGLARDWAWIAHGRNNSRFHTGLSPAIERDELRHITETIAHATASTPRGWLGPALTETDSTPSLLSELGYHYVLDWCADDQPFELTVPGMLSVPYSIELNDIRMLNGGISGPDFHRMVVDQYEQLSADAASGIARVMSLSLHPFVMGQPFRYRYLKTALEFIAEQSDVWITTSDEVAREYLALTSAGRAGGH